MAEEKKLLTVADVISSDYLEQAVHHVLDPIVNNVQRAGNSCKPGERLRSTLPVRLHREGLLEAGRFIMEISMIYAHESQLSSTLRKGMLELFRQVALEVAKHDTAEQEA